MNIKKFFNNHKAFTLAEVLIAVSLIGIIAIVTIPTMIVSVQKHEYKSGVKKAHSIVSESFDSMKIDNDYIYKVYSNGSTDISNLRKTYAAYFGFQKSSSEGRYVGYSAEHYDNMYHPLNNNNSSVNSAIYNGGGFELRNNMTVLVGKVPKPVADSSSPNALVISVDVDGPKKGLNQLGLDIFSFEITPSDNILPMGAKGIEETSFDSTKYCVTPYSGDDLNGIACTFAAVNKGEYLDDVVAADPTGCNGKLNGMGEWDGDNFICSNQKTYKSPCSCVCQDGWTLNTYGFCEDSDKCVYVGDAGKKCPKGDNEVWDSEKQDYVCDTGYHRDTDGICKSGICPDDGYNFKNSSDECITCPNGVATTKDRCNCNEDTEDWVELGAKSACKPKCIDGQERDESGECGCGTKTKIKESCCEPNVTIKVDNVSYQISLKSDADDCDDYDCGVGTYTGTTCECEKNAVFDTSSKKCVCDESKYLAMTTDGKCGCKNGYVWVNKTRQDSCKCANNSLDTENCGCVLSLGLVADDSNGMCKCDVTKGFAEQENVGPNFADCACSAEGKTKIENGACVCASEHRISTTCKCDKDNHWIESSGDKCVCDYINGFQEENGSCIQTNCKNGATPTSDGTCECKLANADLSDNSCVCNIEGMTIQTNTSGAVVCDCPSNKILNNEKTKCVATGGGGLCTTGAKNDGSGCVCQDGTTLSGSVCACPAGFQESHSNYGIEGENDDTSYTKQYCYNTSCMSSNAIWTSYGGNQGTCDCGSNPGVIAVSTLDTQTGALNYTCTCEGIDAYIVGTTNSSRECKCGYNGNEITQLKYDESSKTCVANNENDKFLINNADDLKNIPHLQGTYNYQMTSDVTLKDEDWTPIGTSSNPFKGTFDGNNKTITINGINMSKEDNVGFFGNTQSGCQIANLNLVINGTVKGKDNVGGLVGYNNCTIFNVTVTYADSAKIIGGSSVGGLIGANYGTINPTETTATDLSTIRKAEVISPKISGLGYVGGAIGQNRSTVNYVGVKGGQIDTSNSPETVGGFVGANIGEGQIIKSYVDNAFSIGDTAEVPTGTIIGGFVGENTYNIYDSYTHASIKGYDIIGGFVGKMSNGQFENVYAKPNSINAASIESIRGGFAGDYNASGQISNSLYSKSIEADPAGNVPAPLTIDGLLAKTDDELKTPATYLCIDGWLTQSGKKLDTQIWYFPEIDTQYDAPLLLPYSNCPSDAAQFDSCRTCNSEYEYFTATSCVAVYSTDNCASAENCGQNEHYNPTVPAGEDVCVSCTIQGQIWVEKDDEGTAVYACQCAPDLILEDNKCKCSDSESSLYGTICIKCSDYQAKKAIDKDNNEYCMCQDGYTFDEYQLTCVAKDCSDKQGIWIKDKCTLPSPLTWNSTTNKAECSAATSIDLYTDSDLFYMSECTYADNIPNGSITWTAGKKFTLQDDINMQYYSKNNPPQPFRPIQDFASSTSTTTTFNGNNKTISYLSINSPNEDNIGLFAKITGYKIIIQNLNLSNISITGKENVGGLVGSYGCNRAQTSTKPITGINISNSSITGEQNIGGIFGKFYKIKGYKFPTTQGLTFDGSIISDNLSSYKGGIIGYLDYNNVGTSDYLAMISTYANPTFQSNYKNCGGIIGGTKYSFWTGTQSKNNFYGVGASPAESWLGTETCISSAYQTIFQRCEECNTSTTTYSCTTYPSETHACK